MNHTGVAVKRFDFDRWETKRQLAGRWGVSERSIERWMRLATDPLPRRKAFEHGAVRFVPAEVDAWWERRQPSPGDSIISGVAKVGETKFSDEQRAAVVAAVLDEGRRLDAGSVSP